MKRHTRYKRIHRDDHMHVYAFEVIPPPPRVIAFDVGIKQLEFTAGYIPHLWSEKAKRDMRIKALQSSDAN